MLQALRHGNDVVIIVVYVDDLLLLSATKEDEKKTLKDLRSSSPLRNLDEVSYSRGCHITRGQKARMVVFDKAETRRPWSTASMTEK